MDYNGNIYDKEVYSTNGNEYDGLIVSRTYKDSVFKMLFSDRRNLLELYNAINGTHYEDPDELEINTLENAIYMGMKNDVSCVLDMYEHQSTWSPNLPFRFLEYIADLYSKMIEWKYVYKQSPIELPAPRFIIFYNGAKERPEREILRLSDLYSVKEEHPSLELEAVFLNINPGNNKDLLAACRTLNDYAEFTGRIRKYRVNMTTEAAVLRAVDECIEEGILRNFLVRQKAEVMKMSIYEYNYEEHMASLQEESIARGRSEGIVEGKARMIVNLHKMGVSVSEIAQAAEENEEYIRNILADVRQD